MTLMSTETDSTTIEGAASRARRVSLLGVLLAGALVLSACGGSPEGQAQTGSEAPSETASASASPSADPDDGDASEGSPSAGTSESSAPGDESSGDFVAASSKGPAQNVPMPERPPEMTRETSNGAEAAVEHWFELFEYARLSGDTEPLRAMSAEKCSKCAKEITHVEKVYGQGAWYVNAAYTVDAAELGMSGDRASGYAVVSAPPFTVFEKDGTEHPAESMDAARYMMGLSFHDDQWKVTKWVTSPEVKE